MLRLSLAALLAVGACADRAPSVPPAPASEPVPREAPASAAVSGATSEAFLSGTPEALREEVGAAREALRSRPEDPAALSRLGRAHLAVSEPALAASAFEAALRHAPGHAEALVGLYAAAVLAGEPVQAAERRAALAAAGADPTLLATLAALDTRARAPAAASPRVPRAPAAAPPPAWLAEAKAAFDAGDLEGVVTRIGAAPNPPAAAHALLGDALHRLGRFDEASRAYGAAFAADRSNDRVLQYLGDSHLRAGRAPEALAAFETLLERHPESAQLRALVALAREAAGPPDAGQAPTPRSPHRGE